MKSPSAPPRMTRIRLITEKRESDQGCAVSEPKSVYAPPARSCFAKPANLIAQFVRHHHPDQTEHDQQVGEHSQNQPARFVAEKSGIEQRLCHQQRQNPQSADGEKFIDKAQGQKKSNW